jgi:hypothetical protein
LPSIEHGQFNERYQESNSGDDRGSGIADGDLVGRRPARMGLGNLGNGGLHNGLFKHSKEGFQLCKERQTISGVDRI